MGDKQSIISRRNSLWFHRATLRQEGRGGSRPLHRAQWGWTSKPWGYGDVSTRAVGATKWYNWICALRKPLVHPYGIGKGQDCRNSHQICHHNPSRRCLGSFLTRPSVSLSGLRSMANTGSLFISGDRFFPVLILTIHSLYFQIKKRGGKNHFPKSAQPSKNAFETFLTSLVLLEHRNF